MSNEIIRMATLQDAEALQELMYRAFTPLREVGIEWPSVNADIEMIEKNIKYNTALVLEKEGRIISTLSIRYPWEPKDAVSKYPFVWWFATDPDYAGQGYGNQMMTYVEETILRDTLKAPAVVLGTSARKMAWLKENPTSLTLICIVASLYLTILLSLQLIPQYFLLFVES